MTSTEFIEAIVTAAHGTSDLRTQHLFRQELQVLAELAKSEERREMNIEMAPQYRPAPRITH